jgi:hypothetical protein
MFQLLLLGFAAYNFWRTVTSLPAMKQFSVSLSKQIFWIASVALAMFGLLAAVIPRTSSAFPIYPLPIGILYFIAPIIAGRLVCAELYTQGTSLTKELEKTASNTMWMGIFSIAFTAIIWCITMASVSISSHNLPL